MLLLTRSPLSVSRERLAAIYSRNTGHFCIPSVLCRNVVIMSLQASQVHAWQSAVNTVNLTASGKSPAEKEGVITSSDMEKVTTVTFVLFVLSFASPCHACCSCLGTFVFFQRIFFKMLFRKMALTSTLFENNIF